MRTDERAVRTPGEVRIPDDLQLTQISDGEWRVSDGRVPWDSPFSLIGFISLNADQYEVLEFGDPMRTFVVGSMAEAESIFTPPAGDVTQGKLARDPRRLDKRLERVLPQWTPVNSVSCTARADAGASANR
ncbi:hypothetical protein E3O25_15680 [Cryobacterium sp. TMT1-3]|uniref:Uncharacterized protein n=1 Tax=Cryobacterium luteum TaxID=1424661 RepID=A0A1H8APV3_9MICO|nr:MULTISPECIES: hypothetical protein [Cryobacterium]TFB88569.1 hypothetical protein E3O10_12330 [Cryobacterium luteum]TFC24597.1 hypothetical protein E3O25_15680 [Cryobacterium sp. TMT1-3]SEM71819.1 hypothetical protein SAMN05216281_101251 [Cryobacterium luteum]